MGSRLDMEETEEDLNSDFNYNMVLAKSMIGNLGIHGRRLAINWLKKLSSCGPSLEELRLRNLFAYYLVVAVQDGQLRRPFDSEPPAAPLITLQYLLPGEASEPEKIEQAEPETPETTSQDFKGGERTFMYENSPDGGAFLAAQPIPRCGAFCYLAVVARQDST